MFSLFYDIALHFYALWGTLYTLYKKKSLKGVIERLRPPKLSLSQDKPIVWIHAVSFGEMKAAAALIGRLQQKEVTLLISTCSLTGYEEAKKWVDKGVTPFFLPFDFSYLIGPFVRRVRPDLLLIIENDVWRNLQKSVKAVGGKIVIINGKISDRTFRRLLSFKRLARELYGRVDHFSLQTKLYQERFLRLGIAPSVIEVSGNIKLDNPMPQLSSEEKKSLQKQFAISENDFIFTLGSTHHPEESLWLDLLPSLWERYPHLKLFLVPRHTERTSMVASLLESKKIAFTRSSQQPSFTTAKVILVDQMGLLLRFYQLSQLAFVGGSFVKKVGGHNVIEPAAYGVPTLYGPYMWGQPTFASLMKEYEAGIMLEQEKMGQVVEEFLSTPAKVRAYGERGEKLVAASKGAFEKSWSKIEEFLPLKRAL